MLGCRPRAIVAAEPPLLVASSLRGCDEACLMRSCLTGGGLPHGVMACLCLVPGGYGGSIYPAVDAGRLAGSSEERCCVRPVRLSMRGSRAMLPMVQFGRSLRP